MGVVMFQFVTMIAYSKAALVVGHCPASGFVVLQIATGHRFWDIIVIANQCRVHQLLLCLAIKTHFKQK